MLSSILVAIVAFCAVYAIQSLLESGSAPISRKKDENGKVVDRKVNSISTDGLTKALIIGAGVGLAMYFTPKMGNMLWLAAIVFIAAIALMVYLGKWWHDEAESFKEMIAFAVLAGMVFWVAQTAAAMVTGLTASIFLQTLIIAIPKMALVTLIGYFFVNKYIDKRDRADQRYIERKKNLSNAGATVSPEAKKESEKANEEDKEESKRSKLIAWVAMILVAIILLSMIFGLPWNSLKTSNGGGAGTGQTMTYPGYYNPSMLNNSDASDDFNFGYDLADFSQAELGATDYDADVRARMEIDPKLGAAIMAYVDAKVGTRFLGTFYEECEKNWATTMNLAAERWAKDEKAYRKALDTFFKFLDAAESVELQNGSGITDQMYMNPYTESGVPDIIVFETEQKEGLFLVYTFNIKGTEVEVAFRTECGYQPTNVAKLMDIKPTEKPKEKPKTPTTTTPKEDPKPTTTTPKKDPSKGTKGDVVGPNDDKGPGPDTNNGKDAQYSKEQQDEASIKEPTFVEYEKKIDNLEEINETQKKGGDDDTPTASKPSEDTKVDQNADKDTGNGNIDKPTKIDSDDTVSGGGSIDSDGAGGSWGGPPA